MRLGFLKFAFAAFSLGIGVVASAGFASAGQLVVIQSNVAAITPGAILKSEGPIDITDGGSVKMISESGKTIVLKGPHSGGISQPTGPANSKLVAALSSIVSGDDGGGSTLGAVRAGKTAAKLPDPWVLNIGRSGNHCIKSGSAVLWRSTHATPRSLSLKNRTDKSKAKVVWPKGEERMEWPESVKLTDGATYLVRLKGDSLATKIILHQMPKGINSGLDEALWMGEQGCNAQARMVLENLQ